MFFSQSFVLIFLTTCFLRSSKVSGEAFSNIHLLQDEISSAMKDCGSAATVRKEAQEEFEKMAVNPFRKKVDPIIRGDGVSKLIRKRRNKINPEKLKDSFKNYYYDDSGADGEWDTSEGGENRNEGHSWTDPKDSRSNVDSIYNYNRRNSSQGSNGSKSRSNWNNHWDNNNYSNNNSSRTDYESNNSYGNNNYGYNNNPRFISGIRRSNQGDGSFSKSVKDLNLTRNYYDQFMTRGIRSLDRWFVSRTKRFDKLIKSVNENECLSQCIFTNLQIVDDRGIPKESMFMKLVQDKVTSQQSKVLLMKQLESCFNELTSESEDNSCSYANVLDRCMGLQLKKRKSTEAEKTSKEVTA